MKASKKVFGATAALAVAFLAFAPIPADAASTFTQNSFRAPSTVASGASFDLVANIGARPTVTPNNVGFCTRKPDNSTVAYVDRPKTTIPNTSVTIRQTGIKLPDGKYTSAPCYRIGTSGAYTEIGARKTIVVGSSTPSPSPTPTPTPTVTPSPSQSPTASPTPTVSPTPSPTPTPTATPSTGYPDASNTGVPAGTTLTTYTGPTDIRTDGTVIDGKRITGCLNIFADNVTIKNSLFKGSCYWNVLSDDGNTGLLLQDVEIDANNNPSSDAGVGGYNYTCVRCDVHGASDGFKAGNNVTIKDSLVHDLVVTADSHNDGIQSLGTNNLNILHNRIVLGDGANAAVILSTGNSDGMRNVTMDNNLFGGGGWTVYAGYAGAQDEIGKASNIKVINNKFTTVIWPKSGAYGPITSYDDPRYVTVTGNVWYDGPKVGQPAQ